MIKNNWCISVQLKTTTMDGSKSNIKCNKKTIKLIMYSLLFQKGQF